MSFPGKIIIYVIAMRHCVCGKRNCIAINYYEIIINNNKNCLVWNTMATVLFMFMCNLLELGHYYFRHFHINSFYSDFCT